MQELNVKGFDDLFGKGRGQEPLDLLRYRRVNGVTLESAPIKCHLVAGGFELREDGKPVAAITWDEFHVQCGKTMMGGFVINDEVMLDISSLRTLMQEAPSWS